MRLLATVLAAVAGLSAQAAEPGLLDGFLGRMREHMLRQPDYTCLETVERISQAAPGGARVEDTLRIEVALVGDKEMFAWPGSKEFEDVRPTDLVSSGMFGNGNFALYPRMLFGGAGPAFVYAGEETIAGRRAARFDFRVPRSASRYQLTVNGREGFAGYHGSFHADLETLDLRRIHLIADDIPEELGLTAAEDRVDYGQVKIGEDYFLLPVESALLMASPAMTSHNRVRFTSCRKFTGESSLIFIDPELLEAQAAAPAAQPVELPPGTRLELVLMTRVDFEEGYAGQPVEARLNAAIRRGRDVLVPRGAVARGRVEVLQRWKQFYVLGIRWTELTWPGGRAPLNFVEYESMGLSLARERVYRTVDGYLQIPRPGLGALHDVLIYWRVRE
jgi:hypothetical protein